MTMDVSGDLPREFSSDFSDRFAGASRHDRPASSIRAIHPAGADTGRRIALVGTFAPRKCGIATFTSDIYEKLRRHRPDISVEVYAIDDPAAPLAYQNIAGTIDAGDPESYRRAARRINESGVDAVWLQHEYGIFGGEDGVFVRELVERIAAPLILTPHTVLGEPSARQRAILTDLVARASRIMVMSHHSHDLLLEKYSAPRELLTVIEHGAPDRPFGRGERFKQALGLENRNVLMTFGLLGPGKGIERAIEALPAIIARHPDTVYRILGATHPNLLAREGEAYRESLQRRAGELGVTGHIQWENCFLETEDLLDQLEACDIYLTPYPNLQQSTSGTLSYAVALGKTVVSTPYLHARELLAGGVGRLIEPNDSAAIASAVNALLDDRMELHGMQMRAYAKGRETIWPRFAEAAARLIEAASAPLPADLPAHLPPLPRRRDPAPSINAVLAMSDGTGMLQHAIGIVPDRRHGYCLDDNVRALMLMNCAGGIDPATRTRQWMIHAAFIQHAWNEEAHAFRNFMRFDRSWCEDIGSEDSNGRALWALGHAAEHAPEADMREWALRWFDTAVPHFIHFTSPRAVAFTMLGAAVSLRLRPAHRDSHRLLARGARFLRRLLGAVRRPEWVWFETVLGYDNPRLSQALIEAGLVLDDALMLGDGLETLGWLARRQTAARGHFRPIGSETFGEEFASLPFDQQPLEALAAIDAARAAFIATDDERWLHHAKAAWHWFFGANDRGVVLADAASGLCRDGINPRGFNMNCGAESILAFQLAHYSLIALTDILTDSTGDALGEPKDRDRKLVAHT